jgi:predicted O-methyltransferase YrrM
MDYKKLGEILHETSRDPYINWNNKSNLRLLKKNKKERKLFSGYLFNEDDNHGYFALLHNLTGKIESDGIIVEVGNREGLGILSIYDNLKDDQMLYSIDIVDDIRFINNEILNDNRVKIINDFNSLDIEKISNTFEEQSISLIFFDTIHTYEQILSEIKAWSPFLKDDCVILVDDIRPFMEHTKWQWHNDVNFQFKYDVTEWAHNPTGFGVYLK